LGCPRIPGCRLVYSENVLAGTVSYIAPELVKSEPATCASDIFSFGVILYEC